MIQVGDLVTFRPWKELIEEYGGHDDFVNSKWGLNRRIYNTIAKDPFIVTSIEYSGEVFGHNLSYAISDDLLMVCNEEDFDETEELESLFDCFSVG